MKFNEAVNAIESQLRELSHLGSVIGLMQWDQEVIMPTGATNSRAEQLSLLAGIYHEKLTNPEINELLMKIEEDHLDQLDNFQMCNIKEARRNFDRAIKIPKKLVQEIAELSSKGHRIWANARENNSFSDFAPCLKQLVELKKQWAEYVDPEKLAYDVNIDDFERGFSIEKIDPLFQKIKKELIPLVHLIQESSNPPDRSFLEKKYPIAKQETLGKQIAKEIGFDFNRGRMDTSVHPFCGGGDYTDVRITTRYSEDDFIESLYAVIHETGHGLYEQGRNKNYAGLPVSEALSMGMHESQSLFWERMIGRNKAFIIRYLNLFNLTFARTFDGVSAQQFYEAINICKPSFVRVEADEVTYPLHVILRYEIEKGLFDGTIEVDQLPEIWNQKMQDYLGIRPPNDTLGVLQDVHWSGGSFGYFPSYTLGAMFAAQFFQSLTKEISGIDQIIEEGQFEVIKNWLNKNIHSQGTLYSTDELLNRVTGQSLNPDIFISYLKQKYQDIYKLDLNSLPN